MTETKCFEYSHDGTVLEAYAASPDFEQKRTAVLICHAWAGRSAHEEAVARRLADLGFVGIALDVYGKGVAGNSTEECQALMTPLFSNRPFLQDRLRAGIKAAHEKAYVNEDKTVISGYCFGGLCALDMARMNAPVLGAVSFHGLFAKPDNKGAAKINPKVLALHGYDDPMAQPQDMVGFADEMTEAQADWQLHAFGKTMHAFTNKDANDPGFGTVYSASADQRSWEYFMVFLEELLR